MTEIVFKLEFALLNLDLLTLKSTFWELNYVQPP